MPEDYFTIGAVMMKRPLYCCAGQAKGIFSHFANLLFMIRFECSTLKPGELSIV